MPAVYFMHVGAFGNKIALVQGNVNKVIEATIRRFLSPRDGGSLQLEAGRPPDKEIICKCI